MKESKTSLHLWVLSKPFLFFYETKGGARCTDDERSVFYSRRWPQPRQIDELALAIIDAGYLQKGTNHDRDWNLQDALRELRASNPGRSRKLTFRQQCEIFALMYGASQNGVVALAYGVTRATVSNISGCLEEDPTPVRTRLAYEPGGPVTEEPYVSDHNQRRNPNRTRHYEDVAREFEALGEYSFNERYLTLEGGVPDFEQLPGRYRQPEP